MNLANKLTLSRFALAPVFLVVFLATGPWGRLVCLVLILGGITLDWADGYVARSRGQVSDLGKLLDPLADAVMFVTAFFCFALDGWMPWWMLAVVALREVAMNGLFRPWFKSRDIVVPANRWGKTKTVFQSIVAPLVLLLMSPFGTWLARLGLNTSLQAAFCWWLLLLIVVLSAGSLANYVRVAFSPSEA